jgi:hypothetical protein
MNYKKIYNDFITDRRAKESTLTGYTEKHHIIPRSLGGDNSKENLIALCPEDHIRAHVLLGKIHGGTMWFAVTAMMGNRKKYNRAPTKYELKAVALARQAMKNIVGNRKGIAHNEETKRKVAQTTSEQFWWNNGKTQTKSKTQPAGFVRGALPRGTPNWTEEGKARLSKSSRRSKPNQCGMNNVSHRADVKAKISAAVGGDNHYSKKDGYVSKLKGDANPAKQNEVRQTLSSKAAERQKIFKKFFELSNFVGNKRTVTVNQATEWLSQQKEAA